jgi:ATP-dependent DNA helicase DinG
MSTTAANPRHRLVHRELNPLLADLPAKFESFEPHQVKAIQDVVACYDSGASVVVLDAPTGSGKTLIAECVRRLLRTKAVYVCTSKSLQDQFAREFDYARILKGRANYPTELRPQDFHPAEYYGHISCDDCTWTKQRPSCQYCSDKRKLCPYEVAKQAALQADLAVVNTSYWLSECNGPGRFHGTDFVIQDEADTLEQQLMSFVEVSVSPRRMKEFRWEPPEKVTKDESWKAWLDEKIPYVGKRADRLRRNNSMDAKTNREVKYLDSLVEKLTTVRQGLEKANHSWVYAGKDRVTFKTARVDQLGQGLYWDHGKRYLLMSATIISAEARLRASGYNGSYAVVRVPSTFPKANRRVVVQSVASMAHREEKAGWDGMGNAVADIVTRHPGDRVLVHSVSYDLARAIADTLGRMGQPKVLTYTNSNQRADVLAEYLRTEASVLVAPSMDRGIDLPAAACRVQIIAKVPYPNLGDKQIATRFYGGGKEGKTWYAVETVSSIVQMCGRAVRSRDDWAVTYILDSQFNSLWGTSRGLFPDWWREAVEWQR